MTPCQCRHEREQNGKVSAVISPRLAARGTGLSSPSCGWLPRMD